MVNQDVPGPVFDLRQGERLTLFEGPITLMSGEERCTGSGKVTFDWYVGTRLDLTVQEPEAFVFGRDYLVSLEDVDLTGSQITLRSNTSYSAEESSTVHTATIALGQAVRGSTETEVARVLVHLCNVPPGFFQEPDPSRLVLETTDWRVIVGEVPTSKDRFERVKGDGGGAVTHVVQIEKTDGASFTHRDASDVLEALRQLFNFALGRRVAFLLPVGISVDGNHAFEIWGDPRRNLQVGGTIPWFTGHRSDALSTLWPLFLEKWADPSVARWADGG